MDGNLTQVIVVSGSSDGSGRGRLGDRPGLHMVRTYPNQIGGGQREWTGLPESQHPEWREVERKHELEQEQEREQMGQKLESELSEWWKRERERERERERRRLRLRRLLRLPRAAAAAAAGTINSELSSTNYECASDYFRHVRTRNGEVLLQFFNRGPTSAAVDVGELMTRGIQLDDGGVGRGVGIGNVFGANHQELSSASINGELGNTYERASDYLRHVWPTREVHFPMISFVNVDGRVSNLTQEPHLNNQGSSQLIWLQPGAALAAATAAVAVAGTINSELSSDCSRNARTGNGEVLLQFSNRGPASAVVDVADGDLTQEPHLNNQGSSQLINKVSLAITGQTGIALMNDHSSPFPPAFYLVVAANTVGFITAMISMLLRTRKPWASGVLAKVGAVASSSAFILAMGMGLHVTYIWVFLFLLCIIVGVTVLFGQI